MGRHPYAGVSEKPEKPVTTITIPPIKNLSVNGDPPTPLSSPSVRQIFPGRARSGATTPSEMF
jgi:hypothetical protein